MEISNILKRTLIILILAAVLIFVIRVATKKTSYPDYTKDDISRIIIMDTDTGVKLNVVNPDDIEKILENLSGITLKAKGLGIVTPDGGYELTVYNDKNLEIVDFNPVVLVDEDTIQKEPLSYKIQADSTLYAYVDSVFKDALSRSEEASETTEITTEN